MESQPNKTVYYGDSIEAVINWQELADKLPTDLKNPDHIHMREKLWRDCDVNSKGSLSL